MTKPIDVETVRANVVQRIVEKLTIAKFLRGIQQDYQDTMPRPTNPGRPSHNDSTAALMTLVGLQASVIEDDVWMDVEQLASMFARDVLADTVRTAGQQEPVVMLTGNRMVPAYRNFDDIEAIWRADEAGVYIHELWERIERKALSLSIFIGYPEYDNCIYGVDMTKWEQSEASLKDQPMDSLNDEWSWIDPEPDTTSADETRGYVLEVERLLRAVQTGGPTFELGQDVQFKAPNKAAGLAFTITDIGRDSDNDVWVKVNDGSPAFFDWADILIPAEKED